MKKILIIASLALCCSLLASCEDFLDTKKYGAKTDWETQCTTRLWPFTPPRMPMGRLISPTGRARPPCTRKPGAVV